MAILNFNEQDIVLESLFWFLWEFQKEHFIVSIQAVDSLVPNESPNTNSITLVLADIQDAFYSLLNKMRERH